MTSFADTPETITRETARLLVVDDEESVSLTISEVLRQEGYEVETAASGREAVALLRETPYDLVLTDLHMRMATGSRCSRRLRGRLRLRLRLF